MADAPRTDLAHELRGVDVAFAGLRRSRELDDRIESLLAARHGRRRGKIAGILTASALVGSLTAVLAFVVTSSSEQATDVTAVNMSVQGEGTTVGREVPTVLAAAAPATSTAAATSSSFPGAVPNEVSSPASAAANAAVPERTPAVAAVGLAVLDEQPRALPVPDAAVARAVPELAEVHVEEPSREGASSSSRRAMEQMRKRRVSSLASQVVAPDLEATIARVRALRAQGQYRDAIELLDEVLRTQPSGRAAEALTLERAFLLFRAHDKPAACATLAELARRWPHGRAAADAALLGSEHGCP